MINIYYAVATENFQEITQLSSCGILLILSDEYNTRCRLLGYGLGASSIELAHLQAIKLGLAAVNPAFRRHETIIHLVGDTVIQLIKTPGEYAEAVGELVKWHNNYINAGFVVESVNNENVAICRSLAQRICGSQQVYDSLTLDHLPDG